MAEEAITTQESSESVQTQENITQKTQTAEPVQTQQSAKPIETQQQQEVKPQQESAPPTESTAESTQESSSERVVPDADGYKLPEGIPKEIGQFAHDQGLTQDQLDATLKQLGSYVQGQEQARLSALKVMGQAHLKNWGDEADFKLNLAKRALKQNDPDGNLAKALNTSGYGNHPAVLDFLYNLGRSMQEGGYLQSAIHRPPKERTVAQAMYPNLPSKES